MATAGPVRDVRRWLYDVGLPAKSGIGGGIVTVSPGKGGLGTFAPPLDAAGNSVKGRASRGSSRRGSGWTCSRPRPTAGSTDEAGPRGMPIRYQATKNASQATEDDHVREHQRDHGPIPASRL